jgi:hypothetical protein
MMCARFQTNSPSQIYGRLVVSVVATFRVVYRTPSAIVFVDGPLTTSFPLVRIRETRSQRILFVALDISPVLWPEILESIGSWRCYIIIEPIEVVSVAGKNIRCMCVHRGCILCVHSGCSWCVRRPYSLCVTRRCNSSDHDSTDKQLRYDPHRTKSRDWRCHDILHLLVVWTNLMLTKIRAVNK